MEKNARCDLCGTAEWEWDENNRAYAPTEHFCMGCYMKTVYGEGETSTPGSTIKLVRTDSVAHAKTVVSQRKRAAMSRDE